MREIRVYHVDAFTTEKFGGNTAGVVLDAEKLTEDEMQSIAKELNSEHKILDKTIHISNINPLLLIEKGSILNL